MSLSGEADEHLANLGVAAPPSVELLTLGTHNSTPANLLSRLGESLRLKERPSLRQLRLPHVPKSTMKGAAGLALLDECETYSVAFYCRYGFMCVILSAQPFDIGR